jgi:hypothetical protein
MEHRSMYPEQYAHPLVGMPVTFRECHGQTSGTVLRVMNTRFGPLAQIDTLPPGFALALGSLSRPSRNPR